MRILSIIIITIALSVTSVFAGSKTYGDIVNFTVVSVYDGDTFKINISNYPPIIGKEISIRVSGIDTPEIRGTKGKVKQMAIKAKEFTKQTLYNSDCIVLKNIRRGKYFRIVCDVYIDGNNLADLLFDNGLAIRKNY